MTRTTEIQPLSQRKRQIVFGMTLLLFLVAVPVSVFYAIGYRFDFTDQLTSIKRVGGMYLTNDTEDTEMFVDDKPVEDMRVFQRAAYIQNLEAGIHRLHVQGEKVQTWVKQLPVYAHYVTEVASFNLPKVPQIRLITKWSDGLTGSGIVFDGATSTEFDFASTTNALQFSATTSTSSFVVNPEYSYIESLFASSSELKKILQDQITKAEEEKFSFNVPRDASTSTLLSFATTTKTWRDFTLFERDKEVFVSWRGEPRDTPHYYCIRYEGEKKTALNYGTHVYESLRSQLSSSTDFKTIVGEQVCRSYIRIDRLEKEVLWFDFVPDSGDLILMHLSDGLYVVEADDRAWQNTQLLYPGEDIQVVQDGGRIYVKDGDYYLEVFTELAN